MNTNERWLDRPAGDMPDDRIGALLRQVPQALPLAPQAIMRVKARMRRPTAAAGVRWLRWATVAALLILGNTSLVFATLHVVHWYQARRMSSAPPPPSARPTLPVRTRVVAPAPPAPARPEKAAPIEIPAIEKLLRPRLIAERSAIAPVERPAPQPVVVIAPAIVSAAPSATVLPPEPLPTPAPAPTAPPPPTRALAPTHPLVAPPPAPPPSSLAAEAELLTRALRQLRQERRPAEALATLDSYTGHFPAGGLRREAMVARVDALLALGRNQKALAVLDGLPLDEIGRVDELRVIRGELKAADDCRAAIADFDRVLAGRAPAALAERALYGRAGCRARLGDAGGSQADLREYLQRFPDGRFAEEVRRKVIPSPTP